MFITSSKQVETVGKVTTKPLEVVLKFSDKSIHILRLREYRNKGINEPSSVLFTETVQIVIFAVISVGLIINHGSVVDVEFVFDVVAQ